MKLLASFFIAATLLISSCSKERSGQEGQTPIARKVWALMLEAETKSQYTEILQGEVALKHAAYTAFLRSKIPDAYPEPYLPYGLLKDKSIDFALSRTPVLSEASVALGKKLFFDTRLSFSQTHGIPGGKSCGSCHLEEQSFQDGEALSLGVEGDFTRRNTPTLFNAAYGSTLTWANPVFPALEMQARIPLFGDDPIELGLKGKEAELLTALFKDENEYGPLVKEAFNLDIRADLQSGLIDYTVVTTALASYERTLINFDTKFDRYLQGKMKPKESYSPKEQKGLELFYALRPLASGQSLPCAQCHAGIMLTDSFQYVREGVYYNRKSFRNTGLYNEDGKGSYPEKNTGFANARQLAETPSLMGQFRVPSLRFVGLTAPYSHDGTQLTLEQVIRDYAAGGRAVREGKAQNPFIDPLLKPGFTLDQSELEALVAFLQTLQ